MITLASGTTTLHLPGSLEWADEYDWSPVVQEAGYSLTGALVVEASAKQAGRPITLKSGDDRGWVTRATVDQLQAWAGSPGKVMTLTLRGQARQVIFRHQDGALEAQPVLFWADPADTDYYTITLRFTEV